MRLNPQLFDEAVRVLAGGGQPLVERDALGLELADRVLDTALQIALHHCFGRLEVDEFGQRRADPFDDLAARLIEAGLAEAVADGAAPSGDCVVLGDVLVDPRVVEFGQDHFLDLGDLDLELGLGVVAVRFGGERQFAAGARTDQMLVESFGDPTFADLVQPVLGVEPDDGLAIAQALQIQRDLIPESDRPINVGKRSLAT